jgi:hypothetical protein
MASLRVQRMVASNVPEGLAPERGAGFQTVWASEALLGTEDLRSLENAASFYEVTPDRRARGDFPVRELALRLPSGRVGIGRISDAGASGSGRGGNYTACFISADVTELKETSADPFALVDRAFPEPVFGPLTPRRFPDAFLDIPGSQPKDGPFTSFPEEFAGSLATATLARGDKPVLMIGNEGTCRAMLHTLLLALPVEERWEVPFATHFYRACDVTRASYRLLTVRSWSEAPADRSEYRIFDVDARKPAENVAPSAYGNWLGARLMRGEADEIGRFNRSIWSFRAGGIRQAFPDTPAWLAAAWELLGPELLPSLAPRRHSLAGLLSATVDRQPLADAILGAFGADELDPKLPEQRKLVEALRGAASPPAWAAWTRKWEATAWVREMTRPAWAFWKR